MSTPEERDLTVDYQPGQPLALQSGRTYRIRVALGSEVRVRLPIDPALAEHLDDRFTLRGMGKKGPYEQVRTVRDDKVPGDRAVDLLFTGLRPGLSYTLEVDPGAQGTPYKVFEDIAFEELCRG